MSGSQDKNPDHLLTLIKRNEKRGTEGKLKIFLGMAAGVGKTYAMLQAAKQLQGRNVDILVGIVEHHERKDTKAMLGGIEILPRKKFVYKGVELNELDLEGVLERKPKIVLVDELAHTNIPGSKHTKRYLDVLDILKAGIDVYTTLNIQHIESRVNTVQEITQITIHETIPDLILDRADEIVLIDLPPEELLKRLHDGQIYAEESARVAANNFFKVGTLTALREMALRVAAERVDKDLREYKTLHGIDEVWKASGRLMVAIFASPYSEILIRWTRRVADLLGVTWIGAFVESDEDLSTEEQKLLAKNISLVQQIGGEVISTRDEDPVKGLLRIAQQNNVTQIIVGKSQRNFFQSILSGGTLVSRLLRHSGNIDIYAVSTSRAKGRQYLKNSLSKQKLNFRVEDIGKIIAITIGTWLVAASLAPFIGYQTVGILFLIAVSLSGLFLSRIAVFSLAFIFAFIHNFFFIPPIFTFSISKPEDIMLLVMFFVAAAVIGHLTTRLTQKERSLRLREERMVLLYNLAKEIGTAQSVSEILENAEKQLETSLGTEVSILIKNFDEPSTGFRQNSSFVQTDKEQAVAAWVLENAKIAGFGTDTLSAAESTYFPIIGRTEVLGVVCINTSKNATSLTIDQFTLVEAFLNQIASGVEREFFHSKVKNLQVLEETQKLYKSLLDCVSHELKTPLAAIIGSASSILDPLTRNNPVAIENLGGQILDASERLQRLVENLLDMTRIESGMLQAKKVLCDAQDVISTALRGFSDIKGSRKISLTIPENLPPFVCDPVLANQSLVNIIHNALVYTPLDSSIEISASNNDLNEVKIEVRDHGHGLPTDNPSKIFDKFFRGDHNKAGGVGLGLSIAKGFMEAQSGLINVTNHPEGGAVFTLHFPRGQIS